MSSSLKADLRLIHRINNRQAKFHNRNNHHITLLHFIQVDKVLPCKLIIDGGGYIKSRKVFDFYVNMKVEN